MTATVLWSHSGISLFGPKDNLGAKINSPLFLNLPRECMRITRGRIAVKLPYLKRVQGCAIFSFLKGLCRRGRGWGALALSLPYLTTSFFKFAIYPMK